MPVLWSKNRLIKDEGRRKTRKNGKQKKKKDHDNVYLNPDPINSCRSERVEHEMAHQPPLGPSGLRHHFPCENK